MTFYEEFVDVNLNKKQRTETFDHVLRVIGSQHEVFVSQEMLRRHSQPLWDMIQQDKDLLVLDVQYPVLQAAVNVWYGGDLELNRMLPAVFKLADMFAMMEVLSKVGLCLFEPLFCAVC